MDDDKKLLMRGINELRSSLGLGPYDPENLEALNVGELKELYKQHRALKPNATPAPDITKPLQSESAITHWAPNTAAIIKLNKRKLVFMVLTAAIMLAIATGLFTPPAETPSVPTEPEKPAEILAPESSESVSISYASRNSLTVYVLKNSASEIKTVRASINGNPVNFTVLAGAIPAGPNETLAIMPDASACSSGSKLDFLINGMKIAGEYLC